MLKPHDEARIRKAVRTAIVLALHADLKGDELLMKEVWEECATTEEHRCAESELTAIITLIKARES